MPRRLLHVSASPRGDISKSRDVARALIHRLDAALHLDITARDIGRDPPPFPDPDFAEATVAADPSAPERVGPLAFSEILIAEIESADLLVISTPMHNFTLPAALKSWIDHVLRPGRTFRATPKGKIGLLSDRPVFLVMTSGGPLGRNAHSQPDFLSPYLSFALATIGLRDLRLLRLDGLRRGAPYLEEAHLAAQRWISDQAASFHLTPAQLLAYGERAARPR